MNKEQIFEKLKSLCRKPEALKMQFVEGLGIGELRNDLNFFLDGQGVGRIIFVKGRNSAYASITGRKVNFGYDSKKWQDPEKLVDPELKSQIMEIMQSWNGK